MKLFAPAQLLLCVDGDNQRGKAMVNTPQRRPDCHIEAVMYLLSLIGRMISHLLAGRSG